jgi:hypothetical protein
MSKTQNHFTPESYAAEEAQKQRSRARKARLRRIGSIFFGFGFVVYTIGIILFGDKSKPITDELIFFLMVACPAMTIGLILNSNE